MESTIRQIECIIPILPVRDLAKSLAFYTESLDFKLDWGGAKGDTICSVSRDGRSIMLSQKDRIESPVWVWIGLEDDALFGEWQSNGVKVHQEPQNHPWAYEMKFQDLDGNILWVGTEPKADQSFHNGMTG